MIMWGGVGYIIPFALVTGFVLVTSKVINLPAEEFSNYILWFITIGLLFTMGVLDDVLDFSGKVQIVFHFLAAFLFILSPIDFVGFRNPFNGVFVSMDFWHFSVGQAPWELSLVLPGDLLLFFWIWPMIMALKMQCGVDGLMEGNIVLGSIFLFIVSFMYGQPASALFAIVLAGAMLGFLFYNFYPNKLMSGSAGKSVVGFIIAGMAIMSKSKFAITLIVFAIPLIDMIWVYLRRILHYKPKSLKQLLLISDKFHFHHRLLKIGMSERNIAYLQYAIVATSGILAILVPSNYKYAVLIVTWLAVGSLIVWATYKSSDT
jgi:UDP-GlcNAc:undecaprenyl-phosphate GlcNAc-1-phosphate transferase